MGFFNFLKIGFKMCSIKDGNVFSFNKASRLDVVTEFISFLA